jgi:hypothetical protein
MDRGYALAELLVGGVLVGLLSVGAFRGGARLSLASGSKPPPAALGKGLRLPVGRQANGVCPAG